MLRKLPAQTALAAETQVASALPRNGQAGFPAHVQVSYTKLGHSRGQPRLWLEGLRLGKCGFLPGSKFRVELDLVNRQVRLKVDAAGDRTVSKREKAVVGGEIRQTPIVDVTGGALSDVLGEGARVRATLAAGQIVFDLHPADLALEQREKSTREHVRDGYLTEATLCAGAGVSTLALKEGLEREGLRTRVDWIVDREGAYLELASQNNDAIGSDTRLYEASLEEIDAQALSHVDVLQVSLPCTGHSLSGKAKRKLDNAEQHPTDGLAVYGLLRILEVVNPSIVVSENVEQARDSASYDLVRAYLDAQGYVMSDVVLDVKVAGTIENRKRWWFCAISKGLAESYSMANLPAQPRLYETLGDALDASAHSDESRWRAYEYLAEKTPATRRQAKDSSASWLPPMRRRLGRLGAATPKLEVRKRF